MAQVSDAERHQGDVDDIDGIIIERVETVQRDGFSITYDYTTIPVTILGETRYVEFRRCREVKCRTWLSVGLQCLTRKRGGRVWPDLLEAYKNPHYLGLLVRLSGYYHLNNTGYSVCSWYDGNSEQNVSRHNSSTGVKR